MAKVNKNANICKKNEQKFALLAQTLIKKTDLRVFLQQNHVFIQFFLKTRLDVKEPESTV